MEREEIMWKQRSRALWLHEGDRNTAYFHKTATEMNRRNKIRNISDSHGISYSKAEDMEVIVRQYFEELFTTEGDNGMGDLLSAIETCVTPEMNDMLIKPYTSNEIVDALSQMHPLKSPGPDGMPAHFFHKCWNFIKFDVIPTLLHVLNDNGDPSVLNSTHICLILKKKNTLYPSDFRLISLCNVSF